MLRIRNYFIAFAVVFAISSAYALVGVQDAKADAALGDLLKRIEALESKGGGNVTAGKVRGLNISGHIRTRFEANSNFISNRGAMPTRVGATNNFVRAATNPTTGSTSANKSLGVLRHENFVAQRIRIAFDFDINKNVLAHAMIDSNRIFGGDQSTIQPNGGDTVSMKEAYFKLRNLGDISPILNNVTLLIGRKQWAYGDQRLIGHLNWTNIGRTHDGAVLRWQSGKNWVDGFFSFVGTDGTEAGAGQAITPANQEVLLYGFYSHFNVGNGIQAEPYLYVNYGENSAVDAVDGFNRYFAGMRLFAKKIPALPGIDFSVEPTWQFGEVSNATLNTTTTTNSIQAFGIGVKTGYTFSSIPWSPRIGYEFEFASGDERPGTAGAAGSSSKTFDNLYPLGHAHLGYMDMHGFQNIEAHAIRLSAKPSKKLLLKADLWFFSADEEADAMYSVAGTVTRFGGDRATVQSGGVSRTVNVDDEYGQELDLVVKYKLFKNVGVVGGYSHYWTGEWMEDTNNDTQPGMDWFWLQAAVKF